jgi:hypothetical protein
MTMYRLRYAQQIDLIKAEALPDIGRVRFEATSMPVEPGQALVDPMTAIMPPPHMAPYKSAINGPPGDHQPPNVPNAHPCGPRAGIGIILCVLKCAQSHIRPACSDERIRRPDHVHGNASHSRAEKQFSAALGLRRSHQIATQLAC